MQNNSQNFILVALVRLFIQDHFTIIQDLMLSNANKIKFYFHDRQVMFYCKSGSSSVPPIEWRVTLATIENVSVKIIDDKNLPYSTV